MRDAAEVIGFLARRFSVGSKHLGPPAPSEAHWTAAAALALRAPDHGALRPFRFVIVGDEQRALLAELFAQDAARRGRKLRAGDLVELGNQRMRVSAPAAGPDASG